MLIAIVMYPVSKRLENYGWSKALAITAFFYCIFLFLGLLALLLWQVSLFSKDAPLIFSKLEVVIQNFQVWLNNKTGMEINLTTNAGDKLIDSVGNIAASALQATTSTLFILFLTPVYTALFMYHRKIFVQFLKNILEDKYKVQLDIILQQTIHTYFNYIKGMVLVYLIVGILNSIGLYALGVNNAILFGMLCAIMTIIPYIGIFVSALLPISVVWMQTQNIWYPLGVIAVFSFVQYLEANVIFPKVVGTQLHVSTFAMLIAIIVGGIIWGVAGMVLFIPFVAIVKIITDNIEEWKPLNMLLSRQ
ncbi:MAG: AI-2E family transporter [Chitinophagaceae bacterium]|nr:AI-2E family transporter [Chitinophagaceae bacterium]